MKANLSKKIWAVGILTFVGAASFSQGQIAFNTRVVGVVDAPVILDSIDGPGPNYSAQLFLVSGPSLTPLFPATTFRDGSENPVASQYVSPVDVTVPNHPPGDTVVLRMRVWRTSDGDYDHASAPRGESADFLQTLGGGMLPPANLIGLQGFVTLPEPSTIGLAILGGAFLFFGGRRVRSTL